jgi:transcriptional regulator with XRE-family HTH domain
MTTTTTGAELQTLREICGLTREALAELAGVEPRTVKHWETRKGAGVPDDVDNIVSKWARWVLMRSAAELVRTRKITHMTTTEELHPDGAEVALIRYRETAHMPEGERAQGRRADVHGAMVARLVLDLMADGYRPRVVWFDPEAYTEWLYRGMRPESRHRVTVDDTPDARDAWAAWAIGTQAIPHPADQPPATHTADH